MVSKMKNKSIKKNYIYNLCYQILVILTPIVVTPYISRVLGPSGTGEYDYVNSIISYCMMFLNLGTYTYGQREIAFNRDDEKACLEIFKDIQSLRFFYLIIATLIYVILKIYLIDTPVFAVGYFLLLSAFFDITWYYLGLESFGKVIFKNIIVRIFTIISIFAFVKNDSNTFIYAGIMSIGTLIGNISLWPSLLLKIKYLSIPNNYNFFLYIKKTIIFCIPSIATTIYVNLDKTMLGSFCSADQVGYYSQAEKIVKLLVTITTAASTVLMPRISYLVKQGEMKNAKTYIQKSINLTLMLALPMFWGICGIAETFIPYFLGDEYYMSINIMKILSILPICMGLSSITGAAFLVPLNMQDKYNISLLLCAVLNIILNFIFIPRYKAIGASIATIISEMFVLILQMWFLRRHLHGLIDTQSIVKSLLSSFVMFIFLKYLKMPEIILSAFLSIVVYFLSLVILREKNILLFIKQIKINKKSG